MEKMRGLKKSKKVSWAPAENLCQVRFFHSDDCSSQTEIGAQDHPRPTMALAPQPGGTRTDGKPPPAFKDHPPFPSIKSSPVPSLSWKYPPTLVLCPNWLIVAGEESQEVGNQCRRENRIPEAVYHSFLAIPPNPCTTIDAEIGRCDDQQTLQIPVIPLEEDEDRTMVDRGPEVCLDPMDESMVLEPEELVVASAAAEIVKSNQQGRSIHHDLLLKILSNPKLVERLVDFSTRRPLTDPNIHEREMGPTVATGVESEPASNGVDLTEWEGDKKCVFFNSLTGCQYGEKCACKSDMFGPRFPTVQPINSAKQVKVDREIW